MKRRTVISLSVALAFLASSSAADAADVITRKSEQTRVSGEILSATRTSVTIRPTGKTEPLDIPANDVASIAWNDSPARLNLARSDEAGGRMAKAIEGYQASLADVPADKPLMRADVEFAIARATARLASSDPSQAEEAVRRLTEFGQKHRDGLHYYESLRELGQVQLDRGKTAEAQQAFAALAAAPWDEYKLAGREASAQILLAEDKPAEALRIYQELRSASPADAPAARHRATIGMARAHVRQQQADSALPLVDEVLKSAAADESRLQAEAHVVQGEALFALGRQKEALLAFLHVDVLYPGEGAPHAAALFHLSSLWNAFQHPDRAADARARLETGYPRSPWTARLSAAAPAR